MPAPEQSPAKFDRRQPVPDYDQLFKRPLLPPDPPNHPARHQSSFFFRHRNSLWWVVIFLVLSVTALAFMKSDFVVVDEAESGCGD